MKKTNKKPKLRIKKYGAGGTSPFDSTDQDSPITTTSAGTTAPKSKGLSAGQYGAIGTEAVKGGLDLYNVQNNPRSTPTDSYNSARSTEGSIVSTVAPAYGILHSGVSTTVDLASKSTDAGKFDENGNLTNRSMTKQDQVGKAFADPLAAIATRSSYKGGWTDVSGNAYADYVEGQQKENMAEQKTSDEQSQAQQDQYNKMVEYYNTQNPQYSKGGKHRPKLMNPKFISPQPGSQMMYGEGIPQFPMGGDMEQGEPSAELESQEVFQTPNGQINAVDGPSHSNGGVPVNIPEGTQILSDRLKMPGTKKTFAKLGAKYTTSKEDKVLDDTNALSTAKSSAELAKMVKNAKLNQLFEAQESLKQTKLSNYVKRLGIDSNSFAMGGKKLPKYAWGKDGTWIPDTDKITGETGTYGNNVWGDSFSGQPNISAPTVDNVNQSSSNNESSSVQPIVNQEVLNTNGLASPYKIKSNPSNPDRKPPRSFDYGQLGDAVSGLAQNAGNIWDLYQTNFGKKYDKENYGQVNPQLLDNTQALKNERENYLMNKKDFNQIAGGNSGLIMNNLIRNKSRSTADRAGIIENYQNQNAGITNQSKYFNKDLEIRGIQDTEQNKARSEDIARQAIGRIGSNSANAYRDYKASNQQKQSLNMIAQMYPDYEYKNGVWTHRTRGTSLTEDINKGITKK